jgi:hypothetical protein
LIFNDDLLKSAFYLLSGYQEVLSSHKDKKGRFPFDLSIQKKLGIVTMPVVNYYFKYIKQGIQKFCEINGLPFKEKRLFKQFGFVLTHDIDWIDKYDWNYLGYKIKELLGLVKSDLSKKQLTKLVWRGTKGFLNITKDNPYWNFDYLQKLSKKYGFLSVYFFLPKHTKHVDAYYELDDTRLTTLYPEMKNNGHYIGLHGTVASHYNENQMKLEKSTLALITGSDIKFMRQHRLTYKIPNTALAQRALGFKGDFTLGFAEHEGFRNSFCLPFKLYDFEKNEIIDVWQYPLNIMDVTLFKYRKLTYEEALKSLETLIGETEKFGGILTVLWHNSFFDEIEFPGITNFYEKLLLHISKKHPETLLSLK